MSVFDENRSKCRYCGGYINHWDWDDNILHESRECLQSIEKLCKRKNIHEISKSLGSSYDYLLDLDHTLADI